MDAAQSTLSPQAMNNMNSFMRIAQPGTPMAPGGGGLNLPASFAGFAPPTGTGPQPAGAPAAPVAPNPPPVGAPPPSAPSAPPGFAEMMQQFQNMAVAQPQMQAPAPTPAGGMFPLPANLTSNYTPPPTGIAPFTGLSTGTATGTATDTAAAAPVAAPVSPAGLLVGNNYLGNNSAGNFVTR